jgi:glycosyltransferase involved in cell wall biosynthesis
MLPIYFVGEWHHKNKRALELLPHARPWTGERDGIILVNHLDEHILQHYNHVIIGPGVDFKQALDYCKDYRGSQMICFNTLSPWNKNLYDTYAPNPKVNYIALPFPVEVDRFCPADKKKRFFIYVKHVEKDRMEHISNLVYQCANLLAEYEYRTFTYGTYQEDDYLHYIQSAQFGIWVDAHESQGFALEEALSCNCPLFVYDITSMKDECMDNGHHPWAYMPIDLPATSASYFDETCGVICKKEESLHNMFLSFFQVLPRFTPRQFVLENLTSKQFIERIEKIIKNTA